MVVRAHRGAVSRSTHAATLDSLKREYASLLNRETEWWDKKLGTRRTKKVSAFRRAREVRGFHMVKEFAHTAVSRRWRWSFTATISVPHCGKVISDCCGDACCQPDPLTDLRRPQRAG